MTTTPTLVIAAGSAVTTWECLNESQPFTFSPHGDMTIADVAWNHNGQVLASCSTVSTDVTAHDNVVLTATQSGVKLDSLQHNQQWTRPAGATSSIAFGGKSRYLCLGDMSGAVCLWDLKKRLRVRQFFHDSFPSRQVAMDPADKFVLSLSDRLLSIYHLREGTLSTTLSPPTRSYSYKRFSFSSAEPHVAAVGTSDGSILLYDITSNDLHTSGPLFSLNHRHAGAITGLAISGTNPQLLASSSTDGALKFFDTHSGETIHQLAALDSAITSLSLHSDGVSCAVGTSTGKVVIYDLRKTKPLSSLQVKGSVASLQFAPLPKPKNPTATATDPRQQPSFEQPNQTKESNNIDTRPSEQNQVISPIVSKQALPVVKSPKSPLARFAAHNAQRQQTVNSKLASKLNKKHEDEPQPSQLQPISMNEEKLAEPIVEMDDVREIVRDEVDCLRDDMEEAIRNLHMDMISQFHLQSQEINSALSTQLETIDQLSEENRRLREENRRLREQSKSSIM